ncbi:MAG: glucose 1-dehydrogenase [Burkholderiaceae bacterium]
MRGLQGRIAIVTGGAGGIGRSICERLVQEGVTVAVFDIDEAAIHQVSAELSASSSGLKALAHPFLVDITEYDVVAEAVAKVEQTLGAVDILVNNAGWDRFSPFVDTTPEFWRKVVAINLYGPLNLHHAVLPRMMKRNRGRIINIASDAARVGSTGEAVYSACKGGIAAFSKSIAREAARHAITVNTICPGPTDTALLSNLAGPDSRIVDSLTKAIPFRRIGKPDDYPGLVAFLASDDADYITGQTISVSGGLTMNG